MVRRSLLAALLFLAAPLGGTASGQINLKKLKTAITRTVDPPNPSAVLIQYPPDETLARSPIALRSRVGLEPAVRPSH